MCKWGLGSEPVASGEVMACRRPMAVSVGREDEGDEMVGERSTDLCFFLWEGGPKPSWSVTGTTWEKKKVNTVECFCCVKLKYYYSISTSHLCNSNHHYVSSSFCASLLQAQTTPNPDFE